MADRTKDYFEDNARPWVDDAYRGSGYTYPVGRHRVRIILDLLAEHFPDSGVRALDVACGAGQLAIEEAKRGFQVTGIDQSSAMIGHAREALVELPESIRSRLDLVEADFRDADVGTAYSFVSALGLVEYLPEEGELFEFAARSLVEGGLLAIDCRNRLFNLTSVSEHTRREIAEGYAEDLVEEIRSLYQPIPEGEAQQFAVAIREAAAQQTPEPQEPPDGAGEDSRYRGKLEGRQQTPRQIVELAKPHGFEIVCFVGVHPHLVVPRLNYLLPLPLFNPLSDALVPLERLPIALVWSSKFIALFRKS